MYETIKTVHILAAIAWAGSNLGFVVLSWRLQKANDPAAINGFLHAVEWMGLRVFMPLSLVALIFGSWLVSEGSWGWDSLWVILALCGFAATFLTGMFLLSPTMKKLNTVIAGGGTGTAEYNTLVDRLILTSRIDAAVFILVILDMVIKPGA
jgi:uncharacterized membrane protein